MSRESRQQRSLLRLAFLALPFVMACQMVSGDEVPRMPPLVRGSGGSGGRDVAVADEPVADVPAPPSSDDTLPLDQATTRADAGIDAEASDRACGPDASCGYAK
jgi:hypothetical protein